MSLGTMTWTCLLLSAAAAQPDVWPTNQKAFQIPIHFDAQKRAEIKELDLWVSHDEGKTWNFAGRATPDQEHFDYSATEDGPYWFTMAIVDLKGHQEPANIMTAPVGQRVLVDTVKPDVKLDVDRQGDVVRVDWAITEEHPRPETLKLEYAATLDGPWTAVAIKPGPKGHTDIQAAGSVVVRMQVQDTAENVGMAVKPVAAAVGAAAFAPPPPPQIDGPPPPPLLPAADRTHEVSKWTDRSADAPPAGTTHLPPPPPPPGPPSLPAPDSMPIPTPPAAPAPLAVAPKNVGAQPVAYSPSPGSPPSLPPPPSAASLTGPDAPAPGQGEMPQLQIVNKRQVKLEFDVGKFGPSGLGGVDVYVTTDDGATWQPTTVDAKSTVLPAADIRAGGSVRASVAVQLMNEGVTYGYYVVAKSKAGLGRPAPRGGDLPQIRVELDSTPPEAMLLKVEANPLRPDTLALTWLAKDKHLTSTPITLEWSAQAGPDAQWNPIGPPELENNGRYDWQPTQDVPPNVYLRMTVRDTAGNRSVAQSPKPVLIDLSVPEVTNIGLGVSLNNGPH